MPPPLAVANTTPSVPVAKHTCWSLAYQATLRSHVTEAEGDKRTMSMKTTEKRGFLKDAPSAIQLGTKTVIYSHET